MKVTGKLTFKCEDAGELAGIISRSLSPDNPSDIKTACTEAGFTVMFTADKIGTILSSVDDYLMNAKIAIDMVKKVKE